MTTETSVDDAIAAALTGARVDTIPDVIARMRDLDTALPDEDGLKWFNILYLMVTEQIGKDFAAGRWADQDFLAALDVGFARLYFDAILAWTGARDRCPRAWAAMFERRYARGVARVQFGAAGMNAHINRDLPVAVVRACEQRHTEPAEGTPQHDDYQAVNRILEEVEIAAMQRMATGAIGDLSRDLGRLDDVLAMWNVRKARDAAWVSAEVLWSQRRLPVLRDRYLAVLDRMAGFAGRGLLIPTEG
jgi:hypothetical protein